MSDAEAEEWRTENDLALWREAVTMSSEYRYSVEAMGMTYLANRVEKVVTGKHTKLLLYDVWTYDALARPRTALEVEIVCKYYHVVRRS